MPTIPYLRSQSDLLTEVKAKTRLGSTGRWTDAEYYIALNEVLMTWNEHVRIQRLHSLADAWVASDFDYALPSYIRPPIQPQVKRLIPYYDDDAPQAQTHTWQDIVGWELESDGSGGQVLRLTSAPRTLEARVLFYAPNSRVPTASPLPTTSGSTAADATSLVLGSAVDIDDTGYVKVGAEWMSYAGVTRAASTTTLNNLVRGLYGTTASVHDTSSTVNWGVAMDDLRLNALLFDQWRAILNAYFLTDGGVHETGRYEKMMGYYKQLADAFWPTYKSRRPSPKLRLSRRAMALR